MIKLHETMENTFKDTDQDKIYVSTAKSGYIRVEDETVSFKLQAGNIQDAGVNGVQCEEVLEFVVGYLTTLNSHCPSDYNIKAIAHISEAITQLNQRTEDRIARGVEGTEAL